MSEQLPYKDEQWDDLPLPDGEASWEKMELLLDKDKKRRVPFWWWRYAALALLLAGVGTGGWLWLRSDNKKNEVAKSAQEKTIVPKEETKEIIVPGKNIEAKTPSITQKNNSITIDNSQQKNVTASEVSKSKTHETIALSKTEKQTSASQKIKTKAPSKTKVPSEVKTSDDLPVEKDKSKSVVSKDIKSNPIDSLQIKENTKKDTKAKDSAGSVISSPVVNNDDKEGKKNKSSFVWSAGVGLQQSIAVSGQQSSSYNYNGKESTLGDHIPSVYMRLQKDKWFAQAEFQYAVPQPVEQFSFSQKTTYDVANLSLNVERAIIQKLYYHQLPLSINYYLLPNLSVGAGGVYNILAGAVTEQETTTKNVLTGTESISKSLAPVKGFKDSFLYKTTAGIILQTDYHWKRFSLGLRFTQNLQPFIKYTKPDGAILDEKTQVLQAVVRFRLWSSK